MDFFALLVVEGEQIVIGGGGQSSTETAGATQEPNPSGAANSGIMGMLPMLAYFVIIIGAMYLLMIRPQRKREKEMRELQGSIKIGDPIITSSGMYGKVVDITEGTFIIEFGTNKGVRIPIQKSEVIGIKEPNLTNKREEFTDK